MGIFYLATFGTDETLEPRLDRVHKPNERSKEYKSHSHTHAHAQTRGLRVTP